MLQIFRCCVISTINFLNFRLCILFQFSSCILLLSFFLNSKFHLSFRIIVRFNFQLLNFYQLSVIGIYFQCNFLCCLPVCFVDLEKEDLSQVRCKNCQLLVYSFYCQFRFSTTLKLRICKKKVKHCTSLTNITTNHIIFFNITRLTSIHLLIQHSTFSSNVHIFHHRRQLTFILAHY